MRIDMTSFITKFQHKYQHGLLLYTFIRKLAKTGVRISPYYLMQEGIGEITLPEFKGNIEEFTFDFLDYADIEGLEEIEELKGQRTKFMRWMKNDSKCFCVKHNDQLIAYNWFSLKKCGGYDTLFKLSKHEAYLFGMYTLQSYRGKNIAPFLRTKSYEILRKMRRETFYSISEYFNNSSMKFKKKLNSRVLGIYLWIDLFRKWSCNLKIKEY